MHNSVHTRTISQTPPAVHAPNPLTEPLLAKLTALMSGLNTASQRGLKEHFDSTIGSRTVLMPLGGRRQLTPEDVGAALIIGDRGQGVGGRESGIRNRESGNSIGNMNSSTDNTASTYTAATKPAPDSRLPTPSTTTDIADKKLSPVPCPLSPNSPTVSGIAYGFDPVLSENDPYWGAYLAVQTSLAKLTAAGFPLEGAYLSLQEYFGRPGADPKRWGLPFVALLGALQAQLDFGVAAIGGKDSMSGTFENLDVPPTLISFAVSTTPAENVRSSAFAGAGHKVVFLSGVGSREPGVRSRELGAGSRDMLPDSRFPIPDSPIPTSDTRFPNAVKNLPTLKTVQRLLKLRDASGKPLVLACRTGGRFGLAEALFKMCAGNGVGFRASAGVSEPDLFDSALGCFILELADGVTLETLLDRLSVERQPASGAKAGGFLLENGVLLRELGQTTAEYVFSALDETADMALVEKAWEGKFEGLFQCQGIGERGQGTGVGNREPGAGSREPGAGSREPGNYDMPGVIKFLTGIIETGAKGIVRHEYFGNITVDSGEPSKKSFGLKHIIAGRADQGRSAAEISATLILLHDTLKTGIKTRDIPFAKNPQHKGRMELEKNGIVAIVSKQRHQGDSEQWLLTGFDSETKKAEATGAIQTVIAYYGYTPEFSGFRKQVGAALASVPSVSPTAPQKSSAAKTLPPTHYPLSPIPYPLPTPQAIIPVFPGTNCEGDTARALEEAGARAEVFVVRNLTPEQVTQSAAALAAKIAGAQMLVLPGGFSGSDEPEGSAKLICAFFRAAPLRDAVAALLEKQDGLILGICNGFQALVKLGLLPYGKICEPDERSPTLTFNTIGRHQSRMVTTRIVSKLSPWFLCEEEGALHTIPVSHGEGRFAADGAALDALIRGGQVATQYVDGAGKPSMDIAVNPNGSVFCIEGITSPDGRILGKMAHSERVRSGGYLYKNIPGADKPQKLFEGGVRYFRG